MRSRASTLICLLLAALSLAPASACGRTANQTPKYTPLTPEQARIYEHGVDFIAALEGLEGRWRQDWDRDLDARVGTADVIAVVTVRTLRTDTDPEQHVTQRIYARVDRGILGDIKKGDEVELAVAQGSAGFDSVHENLSRLENKQFVVYLKWYSNEAGSRAAHWHMSPASEQVLTETESRVTRVTKGEPADGSHDRVTIHTN